MPAYLQSQTRSAGMLMRGAGGGGGGGHGQGGSQPGRSAAASAPSGAAGCWHAFTAAQHKHVLNIELNGLPHDVAAVLACMAGQQGQQAEQGQQDQQEAPGPALVRTAPVGPHRRLPGAQPAEARLNQAFSCKCGGILGLLRLWAWARK